MQWFCEFAIPILAATVAWYWHSVDDISGCSSSQYTVSKYEVAPVETCPDPCLRCDMFLLIHFASGVRNKKGTAAVLFWFCWGSNGLLGSGFYMPMFLSFVEFSVPIQGQSRGLSRKTGPRRAFSGRRWSRWVMMSVFWSLNALLTTSFDMMIFYGDALPRQTKHYRVKPTWFLAQW